MKKILLTITLAVVLTACGNGAGSTTDADSTANVTSTTPPPTADSTNPIGVMMSDTTISVYDSINGGQD